MKPRFLRKIFLVLAAFALVGAACGGDDDTAGPDDGDGDDAPETTEADAGEPQMGGEVVMGLEAEAPGLRPWEDACSTPCYNIMHALYDPLMEQDADGVYQPWLAESMESNDDFTVWTMTLRDGVTFHNGTAVTAQTIADMFPIQQTGAVSSGQIQSSNLESVAATGDLEVTYTLSQPNSAFPAYLARASLGFVFDPAAASADPAAYSTAPIGTGPFTIANRDVDNETVVERNPDYWMTDEAGNQLPYLDQITFRIIPDEGTRLDALLSGTTNVMHSLRQGPIRDARSEVDSGTDIVLLEHQGNNVGGGMYNLEVAPLDDVRVRRGLTMLNSQENVIKALGGEGISDPGTQWFSPDDPYYSEAAAEAWPQFDFEGGVALLQEYVDDPERSDGKEAGQSIDLELSCPPDPSLIAAMQVIEQTWTASELVNVELTNFDQQTHIENALALSGDFVGTNQATCWRWGAQDDPSVGLNPFLAPYNEEVAEAAGLPGVVSPLNAPNWFDPEAFEAAIAALRTDDLEERKALYETVMLRIAEEVPIWYSGYTATMVATESDVHGFASWSLPSGEQGIGHPNSEVRWTEVWIG